jgi:hypothetical protein
MLWGGKLWTSYWSLLPKKPHRKCIKMGRHPSPPPFPCVVGIVFLAIPVSLQTKVHGLAIAPFGSQKKYGSIAIIMRIAGLGAGVHAYLSVSDQGFWVSLF